MGGNVDQKNSEYGHFSGSADFTTNTAVFLPLQLISCLKYFPVAFVKVIPENKSTQTSSLKNHLFSLI